MHLPNDVPEHARKAFAVFLSQVDARSRKPTNPASVNRRFVGEEYRLIVFGEDFHVTPFIGQCRIFPDGSSATRFGLVEWEWTPAPVGA